MLCYRCGSHVADTAESCPTCGQKLAGGGLRQATGTFSRRRAASGLVEGAPYKPQELVANRYLVKDVVGAGPLGFVFRAHDKEIDVEVALKVINPKLLQTPDERKQFSKELRLARKLSHPNLVRVYEDGEDQERPFFTSQFLDGLTLRKIIDLRLQKGQFFALHEIEPILAQVCNALDGAHKVGPHSDLKPDNVLVLPDLLKVTDFGLGLAMPRLPFVQAMKARKAERYLAPELVEGHEIDGRADLYSLGVILGEMLSGLTPDGAMPELQRRNPDVPQAVEGFYRKAINHNPLARQKSAAEFIAEFHELVKKASPQPAAKPKVESASGSPPPIRPRTQSGMLQLQPRRDKPPPPVPDLPPPPPPPPPVSEESPLPDETQRVDSLALEEVLGQGNGHGGAAALKEHREATEVIDSGQFIASLDDNAVTKGSLDAVGEPPPGPPEPKSRAWLLVAALIVVGIGLGAALGFFLVQRQKAAAGPDDKAQRPTADADKLAAQKAAADKAAADKAAADKAIADKAIADKAAADKAAADQAAADKAAADQAAADQAAADQAAADKSADKERAKALMERIAAEKAEKAAAERAAADKAAAEKAAADKAEKDKKAKEVAMATVAAKASPAAGEPCPAGMRLVTAGQFKMGTPRNDPMMGFDEKAQAPVDVKAFCVDVFEYPNKKGVPPTVSIGWADAKRLCEGQGKRLCSEAEWEKSCKGPGGARWPFGNGWDVNACNTEDEAGDSRSIAPSGRFAKCRSGYGIADLSGNVAEWTEDKVVKGGSFASADYAVRCSARRAGAQMSKSSEVGFRCCADAP